jgi:hypothetical protein
MSGKEFLSASEDSHSLRVSHIGFGEKTAKADGEHETETVIKRV